MTVIVFFIAGYKVTFFTYKFTWVFRGEIVSKSFHLPYDIETYLYPLTGFHVNLLNFYADENNQLFSDI